MAQYIKDKIRRAQAEKLTKMIQKLLPTLLMKYNLNVHSLNAIIGSMHRVFINTTTTVIYNQEQFVALWYKGLACYNETIWQEKRNENTYCKLHRWLRADVQLQEYVECILKRTYLREYEALARERPNRESGVVWIGPNSAIYGILITPRFRDGKWENDESEIRRFPCEYWTIGHILRTGIVSPGSSTIKMFKDIDEYLNFFEQTLVKSNNSPFESKIASLYAEFVRDSEYPEKIPLLIPQLRYEPEEIKHIHRLDFVIINPYTLEKQGYELSPSSTHGYISNVEALTADEINQKAKEISEKTVRKINDYYIKYKIPIMTFTDSELQNMKQVFEKMQINLKPEKIYYEQFANEKQKCLKEVF